MFKALQTGSLFAAVLTTGLMAGLFAAFSYAIMPGLAKVDDRAFIDSMQRINVAIINGWFMLSFLGALAFAGLAAALHWKGEARTALPWIIAGLVLYLVMFIITGAINVPMNNELDAAGDVSKIADPAAVRAAFEDRWIAWNVVRAVTSTAAFGCLAWALVLHGRVTGKG
ncbi:anthrone oxygenase family protein [Spirillospora sp. NPDC047279]|uniref:anthrone oxygenase family protein n=1 Tax=Spirillospora sp. NPDC047279 TaxID=3155478 RepID=UPI0034085D53